MCIVEKVITVDSQVISEAKYGKEIESAIRSLQIEQQWEKETGLNWAEFSAGYDMAALNTGYIK